MTKYQGVSMSIGRRNMKRSSLESSIRDASNGGRFMALASIDAELFAFLCLETFVNNSESINARAMKRPPFDAARIDDSKKLCFIIL